MVLWMAYSIQCLLPASTTPPEKGNKVSFSFQVSFSSDSQKSIHMTQSKWLYLYKNISRFPTLWCSSPPPNRLWIRQNRLLTHGQLTDLIWGQCCLLALVGLYPLNRSNDSQKSSCRSASPLNKKVNCHVQASFEARSQPRSTMWGLYVILRA